MKRIKDNSKYKVLIIISAWPSLQHPYLTYLFSELKERYPSLQLFLFQKGDLESGRKLLGTFKCNSVLESATFRFVFSYNPIAYVIPIFSIVTNPLASFKLFRYARRQGYLSHQAIGQLIFNHSLIGKAYDLVYINALQSARHLCLKGFFGNTPIIVSSRGQDFDIEINGYDKVLENIDHLHVLGEYLKKVAVSRGFPIEQITKIPPAPLPNRPRTYNFKMPQNRINIVSSSRLTWNKGFPYALRAISIASKYLPAFKWHYHILGDGPEKEFLQVEANRLEIKENITFYGWLSQNEVNDLVSQSDLYLLLSISEGYNNSVLQAQSLGIPCVVSDAGGLPENVLDGVTGLVVPRYDAKAAAEALITLIQNPDLRRKLSKAASIRAKEFFKLEKQVTQYIEMFEKAVKDHAHSVRM